MRVLGKFPDRREHLRCLGVFTGSKEAGSGQKLRVAHSGGLRIGRAELADDFHGLLRITGLQQRDAKPERQVFLLLCAKIF